MAIQGSDNEATIRKHYRDIRDKLKGMSAKLDMVSKATIRPEISGLFGNQAIIHEWLMRIFDELEQLRLEMNSLNTRHEKVIDVLEIIQAWQKKYQPSLDELKGEHDQLGKVGKN